MARVKAGVLEGMGVLAASAVLAAGGNAVYGDDGIALGHNYFPRAAIERESEISNRPKTPIPRPSVTDPEGDRADPEDPDAPRETPEDPEKYVEAKWFPNLDPAQFGNYMGLAYVPAGQSPSWVFNELTGPQAHAFHEAGGEAGVVFVDARTPDHFEDGHIPGAVSLSHFHFLKYWPAVQGDILAAGAIVIYCAGGDCDDSKNLAGTLIEDGGIAESRIFIYRGGIKDWTQVGRELSQPSK